MTDGTVRAKGTGRFLAGDAVRAYAALAVLVFHVWGATRFSFAAKGDPNAFNALGRAENYLGHMDLGVYVFFVLSGFLLARPFIGALLTDAQMPSISNYARNRVLRIVPAFWVAWTVILVVWGLHGTSAFGAVATYLFGQDYVNLALTNQQFVQGWTIGVEIAFYIAVPIVALALAWLARRSGRSPVGLLFATAGLLFVGSLGVRAANSDGLRWIHSIPASSFAFAPGIALAIIDVRWASGWRGRARWSPWALVGLSIALLVYLAERSPANFTAYTVLNLAVAAAVVAAPIAYQWTSGRCWRVYDNRVISWLGERSFAIYLWHVAVIYAIGPWLRDQSGADTAFYVGLPLTVGISCVLGELSWRLVEQPALSRKRPVQPVPAESEQRRRARELLATYELPAEAQLAEGHNSA